MIAPHLVVLLHPRVIEKLLRRQALSRVLGEGLERSRGGKGG